MTAAACGDGDGSTGGWALGFGGAGTDAPTALAPTGDGGVVLAGLFSGVASGGGATVTAANAWDALVLAVAADGTPRWAVGLGATGNDLAADVAVDADGSVVVVGSFAEKIAVGDDTALTRGGTDGFVARFDADGGPLWLLTFGGSGDDAATSVALAADGDILVAGAFAATASFGTELVVQAQGDSDALYARLAPDGTPRWVQRIGGAGADYAHAIAAAPDGGFALAGQFEDDIQIGGQALSSAGFLDAYISAFDADGTPRWARGFGGSDDDFAHALSVSADGIVAVTGEAAGAIDFGTGSQSTTGTDAYVAAYAVATGAPRWAQLIVGTGFGSGRDVAFDADGNLVVAGSFSEALSFGACSATTGGGNDVAVARLDPAGACLWLQRFGGAGNDSATAVTVGADGTTPTVAGYFEESGNFAYAALLSAGGRDIFTLTLPQ